MDGNRNYADEPEPRWYSDGHDYGEYGDSGRRTETGYRAPEPRSSAGGAGYGERSVGPRSGEPLPPLPGDDPNDPLTGNLPSGAPSTISGGTLSGGTLSGSLASDEPVQRYHAEPIDLAELRRSSNVTVTQSPQPSPVASAVPRSYGAVGSPVGGPSIDPTGAAHTPNPVHPLSAPHMSQLPDPMSTPNPATSPNPVIPPRNVPPAGTLAGTPIAGAAGGAGPEPERGGLYHTKRAGLALLLAIATFLLELPVLWAFSDSAFDDHVSVPGTVSSLLMMIGLPLFALGLYASFGGAAAGPAQGPRAWARTPLAYVPIALVVFLAAALAAR